MSQNISNPRVFGRVAVLSGGWSPEREISLQSGEQVFLALQRQGVNVELFDIQREDLLGAIARCVTCHPRA